MRRLRWIALLCAALAFAGTPGTATANQCEGDVWNIILFAGTGVQGQQLPPGLNHKDRGCDVSGDGSINTNWIHRGANRVHVRAIFEADVGDSAGGYVKGLGYDQPVTLNRTYSVQQTLLAAVLPPEYPVYDSAWLDIDPLAVGEMVVTVNFAAGPATDTWRTLP